MVKVLLAGATGYLGGYIAQELMKRNSSERVTEAPKGSLSAVGNRAKSVKAEWSLTARRTGRAGTKVGLSDPVVPSGRAIAQRIKATLGITG
ncbi:hypothetical protein HA075_26675 [bacterium BFN5]|nr:hypothetical protein HA075_26675 [bacterium BFN5]